MTARLNLRLLHWHLGAACKCDLQRNKVNASDHFRDWMLHLDAAVDLNEVRLPIGSNQELQRPHVLIPRGADRLRRARKELFTHARSERR